LLELLVVMSLLIIVGGFSLIVSMDSFRGYTFRNGRDLLVATLERARAESVNNICLGAGCTGGKPHGVYIAASGGYVTQFVIYQGTSYATANHALDNPVTLDSVAHAIAMSGTQDFSFSQLAATSTGGSAALYVGTAAAPIATSTITVSSEGRIAWSN
jgi:Tfp pilus assembly protein FimT